MTKKNEEIEIGVSIGKSNERVLFIAVVLQALLDATKPVEPNESKTAIHARERATAWFFAKTGVTCENFKYICDMANLNAEYTRSFAYKVIKDKKVHYIRKKINYLLKGD
jgi:hypothetical protein|tara:strand:+ start:89 stop:418 length:330 start_codon:yes stop_codon:yes gene_type:complete